MAKVLEGPGMGLMKKWGITVPHHVVVSSVEELTKLSDAQTWLRHSKLVAKAHEALGSRLKLGLVKVDLDLAGATAAIREMLGRQVGSITVSQVIISEMIPHKDEYYAAVKSSREGAEILVANCGGIEVEANWDRVKKLKAEVGHTPAPDALEQLAKEAGFSKTMAPKVAAFLGRLFACFDNEDAQYLEVNPVEQRPRQPLAILLHSGRRAVTQSATVALEPAGTRIRRRHQCEASRKLHHPTAARHHDTAVLERLAQTLHRVPPEFRELVQEQDTVVREGDFAGDRRVAAADKAGLADRVVRRAIGAAGH